MNVDDKTEHDEAPATKVMKSDARPMTVVVRENNKDIPT